MKTPPAATWLEPMSAPPAMSCSATLMSSAMRMSAPPWRRRHANMTTATSAAAPAATMSALRIASEFTSKAPELGNGEVEGVVLAGGDAS